MRQVAFPGKRYTELTGVIHNHSNYSYDCDVPLSEIMEAARNAKLDYLTLNDHNQTPAPAELATVQKHFRENMQYSPVVIAGSELNDDQDHHHLLVFHGNHSLQGVKIGKMIAEQKKLKATIFAAHPYEERASRKFPLYIWTELEHLQDVAGMEIWNYSSSWLSKLSPKRNGLLLLLFPALYVKTPFPENIRMWDAVNQKGVRLAAIGSTDAHGTKHKLLFWTVSLLTHSALFNTIRTNILLPEGEEANETNILKALAQGKSYVINYRQGQPQGFTCYITHDKDQAAACGEEIPMQEGLQLHYHLPAKARVELFIDGVRAAVLNSSNGSFPVTRKGNYRLEITRFGFGWIYTNNIYVTD